MEVNYRYSSKYEFSIKEACRYILGKSYGDTISYNEIGKILGINVENEEEKKKFISIMRKIKNILIDYGYILKNIAGIGYYILKPKQIASYAYRTYIIKPTKLYEKANRILEHTNKKELNEIETQEHKEVTILNNNLLASSNSIIDNSDYAEHKYLYEES